ncbi:unnamed protein product, partial [Phaeothamnion confervicola]
ATRRRRAAVLRLLGWRHRREQRAAAVALRRWGLDPLEFTLSAAAQRADLAADFRRTMEDFQAAADAWRGGRWDSYRRGVVLRSRALFALEQCRAKKRDTVLIADRSHPDCGLTGRVLAVDCTVPGQEMAEIKLDGQGGRIAFVRVLTDVQNGGEVAEPRTIAVPAMDSVQYANADLQRVRLAVLAWAARERETWVPYAAARQLQRTVRGFLARRATARRRHRLWSE